MKDKKFKLAIFFVVALSVVSLPAFSGAELSSVAPDKTAELTPVELAISAIEESQILTDSEQQEDLFGSPELPVGTIDQEGFDSDTNLSEPPPVASVITNPVLGGGSGEEDEELPSQCFVADFNGDLVVDSRDILDFLNAWNVEDLSTDMDGNGVVDEADFHLFLDSWIDCKDCLRADFNGDGVYNSLDILAFLNAYNAGEKSADFNESGSLESDDLDYFLVVWQDCRDGMEYVFPDPGGSEDGEADGPVDGIEIDDGKGGGSNDDDDDGGDGDGDSGSSGGGSSSSGGFAFNPGGSVLGAYSGDYLDEIRSDLIDLLSQLIALLQSELDKKLAQIPDSGSTIESGSVLGEFVEAQVLNEGAPIEEEVLSQEGLSENVTGDNESGGKRNSLWVWIILAIVVALVVFWLFKKKNGK